MSYNSRIDKNTALTQSELDNNFLCHYPVGSLYMNALKDESPGRLIGYGSWSLYAQGYTLLSANSPRLHGDVGFGDSPRHYREDYVPSTGPTSASGTFVGSERAGSQTDGYYSPRRVGGQGTVKVDDYPNHTHRLQSTTGPGGSFIDGQHRGRTDYNGFYLGGHDGGAGSNPATYVRSGGGTMTFSANTQQVDGHNNIQKYITINIWKRDS